MSKNTFTFHPLSRRRFLTSASALAAAGVAGNLLPFGATASFAAGETKIQSGSHWGVFSMTVKDGRAVAIEPWAKDPHPSHQLPGVLDSLYAPSRILHPMVRRSYLEKGPKAERDSRGASDFVQVSWDKAIELVAKEIQRVEKESGPEGIFAGSYGWQSPGKLNNPRTLVARAMNVAGGAIGGAGDYSTAAAQVIMPHVVGGLEVYSQQTAWPVVQKNTDTLVFWAADPVKTCQIDWAIPDHAVYDNLEKFRDSGKKIICIDPLVTETARLTKAEVISPKPQTDVALMLGIAHTLYSEGLHDKDFLSNYTTGFDQFVPYLTGDKDGTAKSAEWAADICGVPAEKIKELAHLFAKGRTMLAAGWSIQRMRYGEQAHWMLVTLAAMLGQIGLPGGGFGLSYHYCSGGSPEHNGVSVPGIDNAANLAKMDSVKAAKNVPVARVVDMLMHPGETFDFNGSKLTYPDIKLIYWAGGNPFHHHQDRNRMVEAWKKVETFIVHDSQWTATARHADIVLPATTSYERNDIEKVGTYSNTGLLAMKKVVDPVGEARSDFDIFAAICAKLGKEHDFTEGKDEMAWLKGFYEAAVTQAKAKNITMPSFDDFWKEGYLGFEPSKQGEAYVRYADFRDDPVMNMLGTPTGMIEIYSKTIENMGYDDCPAHPTYMEAPELPGAKGVKYPLHVNAPHPHDRLHSQLCGTKLRETYAIKDREPCLVNPKDAAARGIADGDLIRVFNDRGQILTGAKLTDDVLPGEIRVYEGGWYNPSNPAKAGSLDADGDVNVLTFDVGTSKLAQGNCGHSASADVEKYTGPVPEVTVFTAPTAASH